MRKIDVRDFQRATRDTPREVNRQIILNILQERGAVSRAELARAMEIPRGMITSLVKELIQAGLVMEGKTGKAARGRKPTLLHLRSHDRLVLGVDLRASRTTLRLTDFSGRALAQEDFRTPSEPAALVRRLVERIRSISLQGGGVGEVEGVGVVVPGMVDTTTGMILNAPTLAWRDVPIGVALAEEVDVPVVVERDAVACVMARMWLGARPEHKGRDFVYLIVSEGVGIGIVVNGQPVRGRTFTAGEFGHVPLDLNGPPCSCGGRGCFESFVSDPATVARFLQRGMAGRVRPGGVQGIPSIREVVDYAWKGDERARAAVDATGQYLGVGLSAIVNALNPGWIIVGGEITRAWDLMLPLIQAELSARTMTEAAAATPLLVDSDYDETRMRGAAALVVAPSLAAPKIA